MKSLYLGLIVSCLSPLSYAIDCSERDIPDEYYENIPDNDLTSKQAKEVSKLVDNITGKWKGTVTISECRGSVRISTASVRAEILKRNTKTYIKRSKMQFKGKNSSRTDDFLPIESVLDFQGNQNQFSIQTKMNIRNRSNRGGTYIHESIKKISHSKNSLKMNIEYYFNGQLSAEEKWNLTRD